MRENEREREREIETMGNVANIRLPRDSNNMVVQVCMFCRHIRL